MTVTDLFMMTTIGSIGLDSNVCVKTNYIDKDKLY